MPDFGYSARAKAVNRAHADIYSALAEVKDRFDLSDTRTQRWHSAIESFNVALSRVYSKPIQAVVRGDANPNDVQTSCILDFLEADPMFFRSGYMKEDLIRALNRRSLDNFEIQRVAEIVLNAVRINGRREFRRYCQLACRVKSQEFEDELGRLTHSEDRDIRRRANWTVAAACMVDRRDSRLRGNDEIVALASKKEAGPSTRFPLRNKA